MNKAQKNRFESLFCKHVSALKRQDQADSTIDVYSRAVRRITEFFDCPQRPDAGAIGSLLRGSGANPLLVDSVKSSHSR